MTLKEREILHTPPLIIKSLLPMEIIMESAIFSPYANGIRKSKPHYLKFGMLGPGKYLPF